MTLHTARAIIVARPGIAAAANTAGRDVDNGGDPFTSPLALRSDNTTPGGIVAYWCSWAFQPAQLVSMRQAMRTRAGLSAGEVALVTASQRGSFTPTQGARAYVFDARDGIGWTPDEVLTVLNLRTLTSSL
ncbi:MAG: hypothetical protein H0W36_02590 [Gemmatimonadetes bacterium]|nr:hypothetical protein [Gemmatimonadota bacterium]